MKKYNIASLGAVFVLASLHTGAVPAFAGDAGRDYNNVVVVLDASGSMGGYMAGGSTVKKIDAAKEALREVLKQVPMDTRIGLLVFSGSNRTHGWVYPLGPRDDDMLMEAISRPQPGGGTPLGAYIKKGADRLLEQRAKQHGYGSYRLLIVTDGEAQDQKLVDRFVPEVLARGITVDAIGVDMRSTHTLATKVHSYRSADDPASLKQAVAEVFAEVADTGPSSAGEDAFAQIAPIPDDMAAAMLNALSASGNQPIGQKPPGARGADTKRSAPGSSKARSSSFHGLIVYIIIFAVFLLLCVIKWRRR